MILILHCRITEVFGKREAEAAVTAFAAKFVKSSDSNHMANNNRDIFVLYTISNHSFNKKQSGNMYSTQFIQGYPDIFSCIQNFVTPSDMALHSFHYPEG